MNASTVAYANRNCPAEAIKPDTEPGLKKWLELNAQYAKTWANITVKKDAPPDAKDFDGVPGKFEKFFSSEVRKRRLRHHTRVPPGPACGFYGGGR
jgi:hypothetical protein